jgi:GT2 family glycosyltransferase
MLKTKPLISIVLPCYNCKDLIRPSINSFLKTRYKNYEINVVDDVSTDGTYEILKKEFAKNKKINIYRNKINSGPSVTRNKGISKSTGKYIAFLETDMEVEPGWLGFLVKEMENNKRLGAVHSKVLDLNKRDRIQAVGILYDPHTFWVYNIGLGEKKENIQNSRYVGFGSVGTLVKKSVLNKIGGFDEKIIHNIDDIDLGWRTWLAGWEVISVPKSITYHWTSKPNKKREMVTPGLKSEFYFHKTPRIFLKNYELVNIIKYLPSLYFMFTLRAVKNLLIDRNPKPLVGVMLATVWNVWMLPDTLRKRSRIQKLRRYKDNYIMDKITLEGNVFQIYKKYISSSKTKADKIFGKTTQ